MSAYHARASRLNRRLSALGTCRIRLAAAVIPALIAYIKVVAVKKLVVKPWA
jgi:energy-converting hydrogenase Eha subunit E